MLQPGAEVSSGAAQAHDPGQGRFGHDFNSAGTRRARPGQGACDDPDIISGVQGIGPRPNLLEETPGGDPGAAPPLPDQIAAYDFVINTAFTKVNVSDLPSVVHNLILK